MENPKIIETIYYIQSTLPNYNEISLMNRGYRFDLQIFLKYRFEIYIFFKVKIHEEGK